MRRRVTSRRSARRIRRVPGRGRRPRRGRAGWRRWGRGRPERCHATTTTPRTPRRSCGSSRPSPSSPRLLLARRGGRPPAVPRRCRQGPRSSARPNAQWPSGESSKYRRRIADTNMARGSRCRATPCPAPANATNDKGGGAGEVESNSLQTPDGEQMRSSKRRGDKVN